MSYTAPLQDMLFVMNELADLTAVAQLPGYQDATPDTAAAVLDEYAKFVSEVVAPLNRVGDTQPPLYNNGTVTTPPGFKAAFQQFTAAGWQGLQHPVAFGGGGLPKLLAAAGTEMLNSGSLSFALCPLLTDGAIEALMTAGNAEQQAAYVPQLIDGHWTGTMNLTEPQAGSDLSLVRSKAVKQADGHYRLFGQKIFITYGEHDFTDNIIHMVLARTPDAPEGVKGLSLFIVPKVLPDGQRNDVFCASLEHKLGIKASPTAVLLFGDGKYPVDNKAGALGFLIGAENRGLEYMFVMMNAARFAVGVQGIAVAERAYQQAVHYAKDRVQSKAVTGSAGPVAIIEHPDVKRLLLSMRAQIEATRALAYWAAAQCDIGHGHADENVRQQALALYEFCVPIVKGWCTEMAVEVCSNAIQVHGGMGFIEDTGIAQLYRDARILPIYEGTTAIQANDLVSRKTVRNGGATVLLLLALIETTENELAQNLHPVCQAMREPLRLARESLAEISDYLVLNAPLDAETVFAGSVTYLKLAGWVLGGWQMARALLAAQHGLKKSPDEEDFYQAKILTAQFFADNFLIFAPVLKTQIIQKNSVVKEFHNNFF